MRHQLDSVAYEASSPDVASRREGKPEAHVSDYSVGYHISTAAPHHLNYSDAQSAHLGKDGDRIGLTSIHGQHAVQACHHVLA